MYHSRPRYRTYFPGYLPASPPNSVFTWVFTQVNTHVNTRSINTKCKIRTWRFLRSPYSGIYEISRNFEKIRTKMGNNPVGKSANTSKGKYVGKYLFTFSIRFYVNPTCLHWQSIFFGRLSLYLSHDVGHRHRGSIKFTSKIPIS